MKTSEEVSVFERECVIEFVRKIGGENVTELVSQ